MLPGGAYLLQILHELTNLISERFATFRISFRYILEIFQERVRSLKAEERLVLRYYYFFHYAVNMAYKHKMVYAYMHENKRRCAGSDFKTAQTAAGDEEHDLQADR